MTFRSIVRRTYWFLSAQFGIDFRKIPRFFFGLPRYIRDFFRFRSNYSGKIEFVPCLHDWYEEGGITKSEYFWQDLLVARYIYEASPKKHVDIGSRVDGFVAHVASFREIEVFDVRPIITSIPGIIFKQADLMKPLDVFMNYCDSLSCLHALEHFGLGRYGDPIDTKGFELGIINMSKLLVAQGVFYLSVPIGIERVEFNANRVFDPRTIIRLAEKNRLNLIALKVIDPNGKVVESFLDDHVIADLAMQHYALGLFTFRKL